MVYNPITLEIYLFAYGVEVFLLRKELEKKSSKTSFVVALVLGFIIRFYRKSIYLPTAWYLAPERSPDGVSRLLQSKSADQIAKGI